MSKRAIVWQVLNSLKARLVISALFFILVLLPLIGVALNDAFTEQVKSATKNELSAYVYSILAVTEVENKQISIPELVLENRFNLIQSGLYAIATTEDASGKQTIVWHSQSFMGMMPPPHFTIPATGQSAFEQIELAEQPHLIYSFSVSFASQNQNVPVTIHIIKDEREFQQQIDQFNQQLWTWLLILMFVMLVFQLSWLVWTLRPLARFTQELHSVEQGKSMQLSSQYPTELQAVARQLNILLNTEQTQRKRYRNALADLAHSLKTPLAVIKSQADLSEASSEQVSVISRIIGHQLKRAQTAAAASWHLGIRVDDVAAKLLRTLAKIYREPQINLSGEMADEAVFKGDEADLTEILGNVLDNACKAAKSTVKLTVTGDAYQLLICIEDDGPGISEALQNQIFERGIRADSYHQGNGIGLAIVRDLVDSYNGRISVSRSETLGGAKFSISFVHSI
ncbi:integral membrane sensor signal transduction histidine kinase [Shewanella baltica OS625]|uniref:histidine kinase n=1 Tax=Shewanella baltica (strain OS195) TaxID=399599 RepID=A9KV04_SHEB9|nr:ATP-binding protein [Shewanella baltica]ABX51503.1 integral membrane sensor signal transduction histidine kinase [Shewanella baltica OS195]ADT96502.1 integral membrane sensor signal transduction histidine kinase [Shewanella baltica OS678]EHC07336.1 integral membrane sensor signal transduction histidine kinase [Shewanella baltica OS625]